MPKILNRRIFIGLVFIFILNSLYANQDNNQIKKGKNMSTFHIGTLYAKPEFLDALIASLVMVSQQKGYISHKIFIDIENPNKIMSYEEWESKEDHDNFLGKFSDKEMSEWLGMLSREPEGSFYIESKLP